MSKAQFIYRTVWCNQIGTPFVLMSSCTYIFSETTTHTLCLKELCKYGLQNKNVHIYLLWSSHVKKAYSIFRSGSSSIINFCDTVWMSHCRIVSHFTNFFILLIYFENVKSFELKYKNFCFEKKFKSRLCFYINPDFLQCHFISAKIYISQIYFQKI